MPILQEGQYQLTTDQAVAALDSIQPGDREIAHGIADDVLLATLDHDVRDAYARAVERVGGFWYA